MSTRNKRSTNIPIGFYSIRLLLARFSDHGQAMVELTFGLILLLVVAWIPVDFGLAFYTGQLALNASREGARIAAADPCLLGTNSASGCTAAGVAPQIGACFLPPTSGTLCSSLPPGSVLSETAKRLSSALLPGAVIEIPPLAGIACNRSVEVLVAGTYNYSFLHFLNFLKFFGASIPASVQITRSTRMRWEHQPPCT